MPCTNTMCPSGRENIKLLESGIGMGAEFDNTLPKKSET
jgi:hypothetical protein